MRLWLSPHGGLDRFFFFFFFFIYDRQTDGRKDAPKSEAAKPLKNKRVKILRIWDKWHAGRYEAASGTALWYKMEWSHKIRDS